MKRWLFVLGFSGLLSITTGMSRAEDISLEQVVLRGLDKVTGRLSTMTVNVGEKTVFGALDVYVRVCYTHPPEETPENAAYLDIVENKSEGQLKLFSGWMFSSSPALSAMEHAVYDVWVLKCQGEPVAPPKPVPLVLENPIEVQSVQPKLKIMLKEGKNAVSEPVASENVSSRPVSDKPDESIVPEPEQIRGLNVDKEAFPAGNDENGLQIVEEPSEGFPE